MKRMSAPYLLVCTWTTCALVAIASILTTSSRFLNPSILTDRFGGLRVSAAKRASAHFRMPVSVAASGPTGPYFDRFGLRYYREAYPGTECDYLFGRELGPACAVMGDYTIDQVYFPDPNKDWI